MLYVHTYIIVAAPTSVMVATPSSSLSTGDPLSLTCTIMLASEVVTDTSLEVVWTLPNNSMIMASSSGTGKSYTSSLSITSLTNSDTGTYTCTATLTSTIPFVSSSDSAMGSTGVTIQGELIELIVKLLCEIVKICEQS